MHVLETCIQGTAGPMQPSAGCTTFQLYGDAKVGWRGWLDDLSCLVRPFGSLVLRQCSSGNNKGCAVLARNPLGWFAPAGPGGAGVGVTVFCRGFLRLRLPREDLLGGKSEFLNELHDSLKGLFRLSLLGVGDLCNDVKFRTAALMPRSCQ